ncbi:MAG: hypothetical protein HW388_1137 [Dehalococcoidia bacterium]|nr:hypothetical protein [Dehalococcoidia bacterium]
MIQKGQRQKGRSGTHGKGPLRRWVGPWSILALVAGGLVVGVVALSSGIGRSGGKLPTYAYNSAATLAGYKAALRVPDALPAIPCYCGCGPSQGHVSLKDCFFYADGSFNDHDSNCHICVEEAADVEEWYDDGAALKTIRAAIEQKYSGSGPSTDTPPVS